MGKWSGWDRDRPGEALWRFGGVHGMLAGVTLLTVVYGIFAHVWPKEVVLEVVEGFFS